MTIEEVVHQAVSALRMDLREHVDTAETVTMLHELLDAIEPARPELVADARAAMRLAVEDELARQEALADAFAVVAALAPETA